MGKPLEKKVEFDIETPLNESGMKARDGGIIGPRFYVLIRVPNHISANLGKDAINAGYKPNQKIKYNIKIERID